MGILHVSGNVTFSSAGRLLVEIGGVNPGVHYDRLTVGGSVNLAGATLQGSLINGFTPPLGTSFTILESAAGITGVFAQGPSVAFDGATFAITYNATSVVLTAVPAVPDLLIAKTHVGNFSKGQVGATYTVTVRNAGAADKPQGESVSVADTAPAALTVTAMSGAGWTCNVPTCVRSDALAAFSSYPPITVTV